jgi:hypothetical protein
MKESGVRVVRPERVELPTFWFVAKRSIQLSYGRPEECWRFYNNFQPISKPSKSKRLQIS